MPDVTDREPLLRRAALHAASPWSLLGYGIAALIAMVLSTFWNFFWWYVLIFGGVPTQRLEFLLLASGLTLLPTCVAAGTIALLPLPWHGKGTIVAGALAPALLLAAHFTHLSLISPAGPP